jgi:hypothetical protein
MKCLHGLMVFAAMTLDYSLMLAAMSFNVSLFFASVLGHLTTGMLILLLKCQRIHYGAFKPWK